MFVYMSQKYHYVIIAPQPLVFLIGDTQEASLDAYKEYRLQLRKPHFYFPYFVTTAVGWSHKSISK